MNGAPCGFGYYRVGLLTHVCYVLWYLRILVCVPSSSGSTSAGIVGAGAGIVLLGFGPVVGVALGLLASYLARSSENEVGEVARGVGKTALEVYNYLIKLNDKYKVRSASEVKGVREGLRRQGEGETRAGPRKGEWGS